MSEKLKRSTLFFFSLPQIPLAAMATPLFIHLPPFYATHLGISLTAIGTVFMLARFWDVLTDPVFGFMADRWHTRIGVRKPWMLLSVPIIMASVIWTFFPPPGATALYLGVGLFVLYVGWTIMSISHYSWGADLSDDYDERARIQGTAQMVVILGTIVVLIFPAIIESIPGTTPAMQVGAMGIFILICLPLTIFLAARYVPDNKPKPTEFVVEGAGWAILTNKALRRVLIADVAAGFAKGSVSGLYLFFSNDVLELGERANVLLIVLFISGFVTAPIWMRIAKRFQKHTALCMATLYTMAVLCLFYFLPPGRMDLTLLVLILQGADFAAAPFLLRSCMADVADEDAVKNGRQRNGLFYSMLTMSGKIGFAMTIGINYVILDWIGYSAHGDNSPETLENFRLLFVAIPMLACLVVLAAMARFPIGREEQKELRAVLDARALRADA